MLTDISAFEHNFYDAYLSNLLMSTESKILDANKTGRG